ncbi:MAG: hypothetical protein ACRDBO_10000 [Lachnospiraceae bacterium]
MLLREVFDSVSLITDESIWGEYAFSRDILVNRIQIQKKKEMIQQAARCGRELAEQLRSAFDGASISEIVNAHNLKLEVEHESIIGERILFAQYNPPDDIVIMGEPLKKYEAALREQGVEGTLPPTSQIYDWMLGHELFHAMEDRHEDTIYTRNEKITLWKLWKYENKSTVRALSEIAAMYFSQTLNQTTVSPFILDVLLSLQYSEEIAGSIYQDIMKLVNK